MVSAKKIFSIATASGLVAGLMLLAGCGDSEYKSFEDRQQEKQEEDRGAHRGGCPAAVDGTSTGPEPVSGVHAVAADADRGDGGG